MGNNLEQAILSTLTYFDIFNYPLTATEIWKWLYCPENKIDGDNSKYGFSEIREKLEKGEILKSLIDSRQGFYFLKDKSNLVELRQARYNLAEKKFQKAISVAKFIERMPGVRMIAVCNSLARSNASEESDIDFFVVTDKNKIWTARFFAAGFIKIFGLRPNKKSAKDKICLSFFVDESNLDLEKISVDAPDIYLVYWIGQLIPIYDSGGVYKKFLKENEWIKRYLPNFSGTELSDRRNTGRAGWSLPYFREGEKFFRWLQMRFMPPKLKEMANCDSRVIVNDSMLKFHANDRRAEYKEKWISKISKLVN